MFLLTLLLALLPAFSPPAAAADVALELTYPVGESPKVFTEGWVFGARCVVDGADRSADVAWSGTGEFEPARGAESRPVFRAAGANTITLSVDAGGETVTRSFSVTAVDPFRENTRIPYYARISDLASCDACGHGCPACPHATIGPIIAGSPTVMLNGLPVARKGDPGIAAACCGTNTYEIVEGDPEVLIDGRPAARVGDATRHCGRNSGRLIGPPKSIFVAFEITLPQVKEDRKPQRREGEKDEAWAKRRRAAYEALAYGDFTFGPMPIDETPFVLELTNDALDVVSKEDFEDGAEWSLAVDGSLADDDEGAIAVRGAVLLTARRSFYSREALVDAFPAVAEGGTQVTEFSSRDLTAVVDQQGSKMTLGPLTRGWSDDARRGAVALTKEILKRFDCFVAHAVYEGLETRRPNLFRAFRDDVLERTPAGARLVRLYYEYGPHYAALARRRPALKRAARVVLDGLAFAIEHVDLDDPVVAARVDAAVRLVERAVSTVYREGASEGFGRFTRVVVPRIWAADRGAPPE